MPKVVSWAGGPLAHLFGGTLEDPRVSLEISDVHDVIDASPGGFDAILLDVDNGPDGFIRAENDRLYCNWGLRASYGALRPGGVLAIWSAYDDEAFLLRLCDAGFFVDTVKVSDPAGPERAPYTIWFASRPEDEPIVGHVREPDALAAMPWHTSDRTRSLADELQCDRPALVVCSAS